MISRLSGRTGQHDADPELSHAPAPPLPAQAERIIRQFFVLMERFRLPDGEGAPEVKASLRRKRKPKSRRRQAAQQAVGEEAVR